jgi:hypothetical protein
MVSCNLAPNFEVFDHAHYCKLYAACCRLWTVVPFFYLGTMSKYILCFLVATSFLITPSDSIAQQKSDPWLEGMLRKSKSLVVNRVLDNPDSFQYQLIYTQIERDKSNKPTFKNYYLNVDNNRYFYPASTVKLPVALLSLEKLNKLKIPGLDKYTTMLTDSAFSGQSRVVKDSTSSTGLPSIGHYIRKIFLVSDNDAYNRLYEFLGQQPMNEALWNKGYRKMRITHRFVKLSPEQNRHTNPIRFVEGERIIYRQPPAYSKLQIDTSRRIYIGDRYLDNEKVVESPMDFTLKNCFPLEDIQKMLQSIIFPESVPVNQRFNLTEEDRQFVLRYMSQLPSETDLPAYDTTEFFDSYTKFYFFRDGKSRIPPFIRVFNKAGWSYGFLTDAAYIVDFKNNVEFMLTGIIYINADGTLNDDKYEYEQVGWPFFKAVGETIYQYELQRPRKNAPDLKHLKINYDAQYASPEIH